MIFNLFSRKPLTQQGKNVQGNQEPQQELQGKAVDQNQSHAGSTTLASQLRTPSPSVDSSVGKHNSPQIQPPHTPSPPPDQFDAAAASAILPDINPADLHALIASVPPQTLKAYALAHLGTPNLPHSLTLAHVSAFFGDLIPPPRLHCVRCHKDFFEVENSDRSCLVPHDDESAEVERAGARSGKGMQYQTLWKCCDKTVEGDGDMGPPDGWCYEGKHTTDVKRARFRADSSPHDDKLVSCAKLRCHEPPRSPRLKRKRGRATMNEADEDDEANDDRVSVAESKRKSRGKKREEDDDAGVESSSSVSTSVKRARSTRVKRRNRDGADEGDAEGNLYDGWRPPRRWVCRKNLRRWGIMKPSKGREMDSDAHKRANVNGEVETDVEDRMEVDGGYVVATSSPSPPRAAAPRSRRSATTLASDLSTKPKSETSAPFTRSPDSASTPSAMYTPQSKPASVLKTYGGRPPPHGSSPLSQSTTFAQQHPVSSEQKSPSPTVKPRSSASSLRGAGRASSGRTKSLAEVVESSIDGERVVRGNR